MFINYYFINLPIVFNYCKIIIIYYFMVFISVLSDWNKQFVHKFKPIPYLKNKELTAVVTGGGRGLGFDIVKKLLVCEMTVIVGVRNPEKCQQLFGEVLKSSDKIDIIKLDLSDMVSVMEFSNTVREKYEKINLLVNNSGILYRDTEETYEGFDPILATNYLGHFLLTHLLLKQLEAGGGSSGKPSRIVNVSSCAHMAGTIDLLDLNMKKNFNHLASYARSKLAPLMTSRYIDEQLKISGAPVMCVSCHPGVVASDMSDDWKKTGLPVAKVLLTPEQGARNPLFCCFDPSIKGGEYFYNDAEGYSSSESKDKNKQRLLFEHSCNILGIVSFF